MRAGIERAKREGTRSGRPFGRPRLSDAVRQSILEGDSLYQMVSRTGVSMGTVTRVKKELKAQSRERAPAAWAERMLSADSGAQGWDQA